MNRILVFAGTTEGRELSEWLSENKTRHLLCVATQYGEQVLTESPYAKVRTGRLDAGQISALMEKEGVEVVVDATHPYAAEATDNIRKAAEQAAVRYLRLDRMSEEAPEDNKTKEVSGINRTEKESENNKIETKGTQTRFFPDAKSCVLALKQTAGNILLTTGSRELPLYAAEETLRERLVVRVLPGTESVGICTRCGIPGKRIIAMQGPFSEEMNRAILRAYDISVMVTKNSGRTGGFEEKCAAAEKTGTKLYVIGRPENAAGLSFAAVCQALEAYLSDCESLSEYGDPDRKKNSGAGNGSVRRISLIGCGMGSRATMTKEAEEALEAAELVFGAARLLTDCGVKQKSWPYYLAKDILPVLEETEGDAAILFSGDSGFYSGAAKMAEALRKLCSQKTQIYWLHLMAAEGRHSSVTAYTAVRNYNRQLNSFASIKEWNEGQKEESEEEREERNNSFEVAVYPGISSVSYLAAQFGISWEDAKILSVHGKGSAEDWGAKVLHAVRFHAKTFLLLSGARDLREIGSLLRQNRLEHCRILAGYQMASPQQALRELSPADCDAACPEGLYSIFILNDKAQAPLVTHGLPDTAFLRGKVPMTKEEVRVVSIAKLQLRADSVVYDIGSGTGSIAVEIARLSPEIQVFAIERKPEAVELIRQNAERFGTRNLRIVEAYAPEGLAALPTPTQVFLGGTGGRMKEILAELGRKLRSPETESRTGQIRIVANAVSFETLQELLRLEEPVSKENGPEKNRLKKDCPEEAFAEGSIVVRDFSIVSVSAVRTREVGSYHMMQAENPVWICSFVLRSDVF